VNCSVTTQDGRYVLAGLAKRLPNIAPACLAAASLQYPITSWQIDPKNIILLIPASANDASRPCF
jgi:hypothetical protein